MSTKPNTNQITYDTGSNKQDLNNILDTIIPITDYTALRNYTGRATQVRITADGIAGFFKYDSTDATSTDNGGTIIVAGTKRWKRVFDGAVNVKWFGAVGNGVTDDTAALVAATLALQNEQTLDFGNGTYLISYQGTPYSSINGNVVMDFLNKSDIGLVGNGATIRVVNHNITTNGGLRFANFKGCKRVHIEGFNFDMTFTGVNTSASFYPFCGAITVIDDNAATQEFSTLNSDFLIERCTFKLFHPYGNWALSGTTYVGDPNNGYKLFSIFAYGPHTPSTDENLCRNITVDNCTWLDGHNGYGIWVWAWNNCKVTGCTVTNWATKHSTSAGVYAGGGVAFIRNIPFWAHGMVVTDNHFSSRPSASRSEDFAGISQFYMQANNMSGVGSGKGETIISNNVVINGGAAGDMCVFHNDYGNLIVSNNQFDGHDGQLPAVGAQGITFTPSTTGGLGESTLSVTGNTFGEWLHGGAVFFQNGSNTNAGDRRCRSLVVTDNIQRSGDFFVRMTGYSYSTYEGCPYTVITGNVIDGTRTSLFPPPSPNNYGIAYAGNAVGDIGVIANNLFINKTQPILTNAGYASANSSLRRYGNSYSSITTPYDVANIFPIDKLEIPQIQFPSTPVLSTNANTLDDYEEGTFTPTIIGTTTAGVGTYTRQIGRYQKIGNRVYFSITISWTTHTGSPNMFIAGLPFVSANIAGHATAVSIIPVNITLSANEYITAIINPNESLVTLLRHSTGTSGINLVPLDTSGDLHLSGHYEVSV